MRTLSHLVYSVMHGEPVQDCFVSNLQQHSGQKCSWCTCRAILLSNAAGICGVWFGFLSLRWASLSMLHQRMFLSSSINDAFIDVQVTSMCRDPYFHRCWILMVSLLFSQSPIPESMHPKDFESTALYFQAFLRIRYVLMFITSVSYVLWIRLRGTNWADTIHEASVYKLPGGEGILYA